MMTRNIDGNYDVLLLLPKMNQMHNYMIKKFIYYPSYLQNSDSVISPYRIPITFVMIT